MPRPTTRATSTFEITAWDAAEPYDAPADGPPLARVTVRKAFRGDLTAEGVAELLTCRSAGGGAGYVAVERVTGRLGAREGTFVLQHGGTAEPDGTTAPFGYVVPGSGTGALAGLRGTATFRHDADGAVFILDYALDDA